MATYPSISADPGVVYVHNGDLKLSAAGGRFMLSDGTELTAGSSVPIGDIVNNGGNTITGNTLHISDNPTALLTTGNVAFGSNTSASGTRLYVSGNSYITSTLNVGDNILMDPTVPGMSIGHTSTPTVALDVTGDIKASGHVDTSELRVQASSGTHHFFALENSDAPRFGIWDGSVNQIHGNSDGDFYALGKVAVGGSDHSDTTLHVTGNVHSTGDINTGTGTSVGIGTTAQSSVLSVVGTNPYSAAPTEEGIHIGQATDGFSVIEVVGTDNKGIIDFTKGGQDWFYRLISNDGSRNNLDIMTTSTTAMSIAQSGKVGVNTLVPTATLHVTGNVHATEDITTSGGYIETKGAFPTNITGAPRKMDAVGVAMGRYNTDASGIEVCYNETGGEGIIDFAYNTGSGENNYQHRITSKSTGLQFFGTDFDTGSTPTLSLVGQNVGINQTNTPNSTLHVEGNAYVSSDITCGDVESGTTTFVKIKGDDGGIEIQKIGGGAYIDFKGPTGGTQADANIRVQHQMLNSVNGGTLSNALSFYNGHDIGGYPSVSIVENGAVVIGSDETDHFSNLYCRGTAKFYDVVSDPSNPSNNRDTYIVINPEYLTGGGAIQASTAAGIEKPIYLNPAGLGSIIINSTDNPETALEVNGSALGTAVGNQNLRFQCKTNSGGPNLDRIRTYAKRTGSSPSDWTTCSWHIQRIVDTTYKGFLAFHGDNTQQLSYDNASGLIQDISGLVSINKGSGPRSALEVTSGGEALTISNSTTPGTNFTSLSRDGDGLFIQSMAQGSGVFGAWEARHYYTGDFAIFSRGGADVKYLIYQSTTNYWSMKMIAGVSPQTQLYFFYGSNSSAAGRIDPGTSNTLMNFTGQHRTLVSNVVHTDAESYKGLIVCADRNDYMKMSGGVARGKDAIHINESLPLVSLSNVAQDKRCFGVISDAEDPEVREDKFGVFVSNITKEDGDTRIYINSVGEGAIWVSNVAGSLESGDYITTSNITGYGQKQGDDILHNYTVAKITMDCDFNPSVGPKKVIRTTTATRTVYTPYMVDATTAEDYNSLPENERQSVTYMNRAGDVVTESEYNDLEDDERGSVKYEKRVYGEETTKLPSSEHYDEEVREGVVVNDLDANGEIQWEDHPTETESAYEIRYLDAAGAITDEANAVHKAAFVGCTYHCG